MALTLLIILAGLLGGVGFSPDADAVRSLAEWRGANPEIEPIAASITHVGGGAFLVSAAVLGAIVLAVRKCFAQAVALLVATLGGRLLIEGIKLAVARPRPSFDDHPVYTTNFSFPSGHAGNSMMTFLALAWFLSPPRHRASNLAIALAASVAIGATRPVLGVHWPSDIVAGWALGILWVSLVASFSRRASGAA